MKTWNFTRLIIAFITLSFPSLLLLTTNQNKARSQTSQPIDFLCKESHSDYKKPTILYRATAEEAQDFDPTPLIIFETGEFDSKNYSPKSRCFKIADRLDNFYAEGTLGNLVLSQVNGYNVICALPIGVKECSNTVNSDRVLITIPPSHYDPYKDLIDIKKSMINDPEGIDEIYRNNNDIWDVNESYSVNFVDLMIKLRYLKSLQD